MIEIKNLEFAYKIEPVLKAINTEIAEGEFIALVGPNGSGKSTLIKCIGGILKPIKGSVRINQQDIHDFDNITLARTVAYVPQLEFSLYPVNVFDAVLLGRKPYFAWSPGKKDYEAVMEALIMLELDDIAMANLTELSGGQRQRVYIARAIAQEADVFLMDEPTANLDIRHALDVLQLLQNLADKGITVVIAIHDLNMAVRYCSRLMMLQEGTLFSSGGREILTAENIKKLYSIDVDVMQEGEKVFFVPN